MAWARRPRYCCTNVRDGCFHALSDTLFSQAEYDSASGTCTGTAARPGCGHPLQPGLPLDQRARWLTLGAATVGGLAACAMLLRVYVFPAPLEHISFTSGQTTVVDTAGQVTVTLRRTQGQEVAARLDARVVDGSARSGEDYVAPLPPVDFAAGASETLIQITILRDTSFRKRDRHFSVVLANVKGEPRHRVVITPPVFEQATRVAIEQSVLSASRISADMASLVVKLEAMEKLMSLYREDAARFEEAQQQHRAVAGNLVRAREAYLRAVQDLRSQPAQEVLATVDRLTADLRSRGMKQQADTLPLLGRHLQELLNGRPADMDRWTGEIGATVARVPGWKQGVPRT